MKKQTRNLILMSLFLSLGAVAGLTEATASEKDLATYLNQEITSMDDAVRNELGKTEAEQANQTTVPSVEESYFLRWFWQRVRPYVGISIPELATFQIIPEGELLWDKQAPEGWEIYRR